MGYLPKLIILVALLSCLVATQPPAAADSIAAPNGSVCIVNAFVESSSANHISQIGNGTIQFGTALVIETDCGESYNVTLNGVETIENPQGFVFYRNISENTHSLSIQGDGWGINYSALSFWPDNQYQNMMGQYAEQPAPNGDFWTLSNMRSHEAFVAVLSVGLAWLVSVMIVDRVAEYVTSRTLIEEVIE